MWESLEMKVACGMVKQEESIIGTDGKLSVVVKGLEVQVLLTTKSDSHMGGFLVLIVREGGADSLSTGIGEEGKKLSEGGLEKLPEEEEGVSACVGVMVFSTTVLEGGTSSCEVSIMGIGRQYESD